MRNLRSLAALLALSASVALGLPTRLDDIAGSASTATQLDRGSYKPAVYWLQCDVAVYVDFGASDVTAESGDLTLAAGDVLPIPVDAPVYLALDAVSGGAYVCKLVRVG